MTITDTYTASEHDVEIVQAAGMWSIVRDLETGRIGAYQCSKKHNPRIVWVSDRLTGKRGGYARNMAQEWANRLGLPQRLRDTVVGLYA